MDAVPKITRTTFAIIVIIGMSLMTQPVCGVREGAINRNHRPNRRPSEGDTTTKDAVSGWGLGVIIPAVIFVFFMLLLCCCMRMNSQKTVSQAQNRTEIATSAQRQPEPPPMTREQYNAILQTHAPPAYNSLSDPVEQEPPPSYDEFLRTAKTSKEFSDDSDNVTADGGLKVGNEQGSSSALQNGANADGSTGAKADDMSCSSNARTNTEPCTETVSENGAEQSKEPDTETGAEIDASTGPGTRIGTKTGPQLNREPVRQHGTIHTTAANSTAQNDEDTTRHSQQDYINLGYDQTSDETPIHSTRTETISLERAKSVETTAF